MYQEILDKALTAGLVGGALAVIAVLLGYVIEKAKYFFGRNLFTNSIQQDAHTTNEESFDAKNDPKPDVIPVQEKLNSTSKNRENFLRATTMIEYHAATRTAWQKLNSAPEKIKTTFLESIENNPDIDPLQEADKLVREYKKSLTPFSAKEMNQALLSARARGTEAEQEFLRVAEILGDRADADEILETIKKKFPQNSEISSGIYRAERVGMFEVKGDGSVTVFSETGPEKRFSSFQEFHKAYPFTRIKR